MLLLELPQRGPLRLPDGLAGRLHLELHQRRAFFFRFTRRGWLWLGLGVSAGTAACAWAGSAGFGGVREVRFWGVGAAIFGIRRRVIRPCPTVHRFVVIQ